MAAFKKGMVFSTKDYVIICCLTVLYAALGIFSRYSKEQFQEIIQESLQNPFKAPIFKYLRDAGWKSVWTFFMFYAANDFWRSYCFFPLLFILLAMVKPPW